MTGDAQTGYSGGWPSDGYYAATIDGNELANIRRYVRQTGDTVSRRQSGPGRQGTNFLNLRDAGDPVDVAARYEEEGADELVFLDITASHEGRDIILDVVRRTAEVIFMPLTVGGGIRTIDDIRAC